MHKLLPENIIILHFSLNACNSRVLGLGELTVYEEQISFINGNTITTCIDNIKLICFL